MIFESNLIFLYLILTLVAVQFLLMFERKNFLSRSTRDSNRTRTAPINSLSVQNLTVLESAFLAKKAQAQGTGKVRPGRAAVRERGALQAVSLPNIREMSAQSYWK